MTLSADTKSPAVTPAASRARATARPRGAARREALLDAALLIVADVGADAVTHRRVAEVAGLPLASTTYWFQSKEHLLTAALQLAAERDIAWLHDLAGAGDEGSDPIESVVAAIATPLHDGLPCTRASLTATYALLLEAARRPALREIAGRWQEAYVATLGALLEQAGSTRPREDAGLMLAAADGLLIAELARGGASDLRPRLRRLATILVNG
jgi:DNA-binding transcriptional regulator YbjK